MMEDFSQATIGSTGIGYRIGLPILCVPPFFNPHYIKKISNKGKAMASLSCAPCILLRSMRKGQRGGGCLCPSPLGMA